MQILNMALALAVTILIFLTKLNLSDGPKSVQLQIFLTENSPNEEEFPNLSNIWDSEDKILRGFYYLYQ
jgi:hypothetical protein